MPGEVPQRGMVDPDLETGQALPAQALVRGCNAAIRKGLCVGASHQLTGMQSTSTSSVRHGDMQHYLHRMHRLLDEVEAEHSQVCCRVQAPTQGQTASRCACGNIMHIAMESASLCFCRCHCLEATGGAL